MSRPAAGSAGTADTKKLQHGKSIATIASELETETAVIQEILENLSSH